MAAFSGAFNTSPKDSTEVVGETNGEALAEGASEHSSFEGNGGTEGNGSRCNVSTIPFCFVLEKKGDARPGSVVLCTSSESRSELHPAQMGLTHGAHR